MYVYITVWDNDQGENSFVLKDEVDEFEFLITDDPGSAPQTYSQKGIRQNSKTL